MEYTVETQIDGVVTDTLGSFYWADKADAVARKESRKFTARNVVVVVTTDQRKRGYPKAFRMGRLYTI